MEILKTVIKQEGEIITLPYFLALRLSWKRQIFEVLKLRRPLMNLREMLSKELSTRYCVCVCVFVRIGESLIN